MAGTDKTQSPAARAPPRSVMLVNPQLGENIGTAARAMANFGLHRAAHCRSHATAGPTRGPSRPPRAPTGSSKTAKVFDRPSRRPSRTINCVYATTARPRGMVKEVLTPEQAGHDMRRRIGEGEKLAILFGRERWGLNNDEVSLADIIITAPVNPAFASLNIAQAVLLVGYEWYQHRRRRPSARRRPSLPPSTGPGLQTPDTRPATKEELYGFFDHLESELDAAGFFKTAEKKPGMVRNMRNLFRPRRAYRAGSALACAA